MNEWDKHPMKKLSPEFCQKKSCTLSPVTSSQMQIPEVVLPQEEQKPSEGVATPTSLCEQ